MRNDATNSGGFGWLVIVLVLLMISGAAASYWMRQRERAVAALALEAARVSEAQVRQQAEQFQARAALANEQSDADQPAAAADGGSIRTAVESVLRAQAEAWNRGDIDEFVEHYWRSDDLTFSSGGKKTTRGWEETARRYHERYPTPTEMGRLTFGKLEITPLGAAAALVLGEWRLERESEPVSGNFSLVFRQIDGRWVIVHDHTSRLAE